MKAALALIAVFGLLPQAPARAAAPAKAAAKAPSPAAPAQKAGQRRVLRLDEVTVEGRIQKPQAFFILQRSQLSFEQLEKKESFLPKIVKSTEKDPF